jgi:hypothetical protein
MKLFKSLPCDNYTEINNQIKDFLVKGISDKGLLLLEDKNGVEIELDVKEVKWHY